MGNPAAAFRNRRLERIAFTWLHDNAGGGAVQGRGVRSSGQLDDFGSVSMPDPGTI